MKRLGILAGAMALCMAAQSLPAAALTPVFEEWFEDSSLRLDYEFCGNSDSQEIFLQDVSRAGEWAGRRERLDELLLEGNGKVELVDPSSGRLLYVNSFSSLFQEWVATEEATKVSRAFENCFYVPFPKSKVLVRITLMDTRRNVKACLEHEVDPSDILIRTLKDPGHDRKVLHKGGELGSACDVVILAEGYTSRKAFYRDARRAVDALLSHSPFKENADRFNFTAVATISHESGVSIPHSGIWKDTAFSSHYDTFYSDRYLTSSSLRRVYDAVGTVPAEHVILLVNTPAYGGGGIYNSLTIIASGHPTFPKVLVHEFGHAFAGLGDEYAYDDQYEPTYFPDIEPWEPNLTTLADFSVKWKDMLPEGVTIPTPVDEIEKGNDVRKIWTSLSEGQKASLNLKLGVYEGAGYMTKGVYRPVQECRMRINECEEFCPVCSRAIVRMIDYSCTDRQGRISR